MLVALHACRPAAVTLPPTGSAPLPAIAAPGSAVWPIDAQASELHILAFRAGALAQFGHNHVIAAQALEGAVYRAPELGESTFELSVPVAELAVDPADLRTRYGPAFASTPSENDIAGTRRNMLGPALLDAASYPRIRMIGALADADGHGIAMDLLVKDARLQRVVPISLTLDGDTLTATGELTLRHDELGLVPFSALLGAIQVAEVLEVRFVITARRPAPAQAGRRRF